MVVTPEEVSSVCALVEQLTGIQWDAEKSYLIESRLGAMLHEHRIDTLAGLIAAVKASNTSPIRADFINAVTTRETLFFRDDGPFNALRHKALPEIIDAKAGTVHCRRLRIWSAACSSGQEVYSLGIILRELIDDIDEWDVKILGTDLSPAAIASASRGIYSDFEMSRGISPTIRDRHFVKVPNGWRICDEVRSLACFEPRNLLEPFSNLGPFDVIFCRNVAIYFDEPAKRDLFERLSGVLLPHGTIFIGSSETVAGLGERWIPQYHCRGVYFQPNRNSSVANSESASAAPPRLSTTTPAPSRPDRSASAASQSRPRSPTAPTPLRPGVPPLAPPATANGTSRFANVAKPSRATAALKKPTTTARPPVAGASRPSMKRSTQTSATATPDKPALSNPQSSVKAGSSSAARQLLAKARRARLANASATANAPRNVAARPLDSSRLPGRSAAPVVARVSQTSLPKPAVAVSAGLTRSTATAIRRTPVAAVPVKPPASTLRSSTLTGTSSVAGRLLATAKRDRDAKAASASTPARVGTARPLPAAKLSERRSSTIVARVSPHGSTSTVSAAASPRPTTSLPPRIPATATPRRSVTAKMQRSFSAKPLTAASKLLARARQAKAAAASAKATASSIKAVSKVASPVKSLDADAEVLRPAASHFLVRLVPSNEPQSSPELKRTGDR